MVWNLPNALTASRVALIPFFVGCSHLPGAQGSLLATLFFALAALTDWADGYIARRRGELTPFGRFFDPVADKLLVISALALLLSLGRAPLVLVLILIAREITVMGLREYMSGLGSMVAVSWVGKWKTACQMAAIILLLMHGVIPGDPLDLAGIFCLTAAAVLSLWSGYLYLAGAWPHIRGRQGGVAPS